MILVINKDKKLENIIEDSNFSKMGVWERTHMEEWIAERPDILGEELLTITTEYDGFDKSNKRLDILAVDKKGKLVVIELKRDVADTFVDLQAIHYAAYCSTHTLDDMVEIMADHHGKTEDEAEALIRDFIDDEEFIDFDNQPRIILVSNKFKEETLAAVLWLRDFEVDITCVKLEAYELEEKIVVTPSVIVPLPEAKSFMVHREKKNRIISSESKNSEEYHLNKASDQIKELYAEMKEKILDLGDKIEVKPKKWYIAFVSNSNFLYVEIFKKQIKFTLNLKIGELDDAKNVAKDVSTIGHRGNGDYMITVANGEDLEYVMTLIQQAYQKYNSK